MVDIIARELPGKLILYTALRKAAENRPGRVSYSVCSVEPGFLCRFRCVLRGFFHMRWAYLPIIRSKNQASLYWLPLKYHCSQECARSLHL